jgi:hypothetical protein
MDVLWQPRTSVKSIILERHWGQEVRSLTNEPLRLFYSTQLAQPRRNPAITPISMRVGMNSILARLNSSLIFRQRVVRDGKMHVSPEAPGVARI